MAQLKVTFGPEERQPQQGDMFANPQAAWLFAAAGFCAAEDIGMDRWSIDQRFLAGGVWYRVEWSEAREEWDVTPEEAV